MFVSELVVLSSNNNSLARLEGLLFSPTPEEHCTRVVSSVLMSIYAQEKHCTWVVSFVLGTLRAGCWYNPDLKVFGDLMMFFNGKMIFIITLILVWKSRTISALLWTWSNHEVIWWLVIFLYHNWSWKKLIIIKWFRSVSLPFHFCRNHTIWCMSRVDTSLVRYGKHDWFQCWNCLGSPETVSDHPGRFGTQQSMIFCCLITFFTTVVTLPDILSEESLFILPHFRIFL